MPDLPIQKSTCNLTFNLSAMGVFQFAIILYEPNRHERCVLLHIYFKRSYCSLCTLDTIHKLFFATRLIINNINKVQWVDFKFENVLVSLHSLKTMGLGPFGALAPLFLRNGELLGHSPIHTCLDHQPICTNINYI
jgi:hypothetical protein